MIISKSTDRRLSSDILKERNELCEKLIYFQELVTASAFIKRRNRIFNENINQCFIKTKAELMAFDRKHQINFIEELRYENV